MRLKITKLILTSVLLCSTILAVSMMTMTPRNTTSMSTELQGSAINQQPRIIFIGDPVPGGGTPNGNKTTEG
jgi:hypothetical protein